MIRLQAQGEAIKAGIAGDLYVKVHVKPHQTFRRDGANLINAAACEKAHRRASRHHGFNRITRGENA